MQWFIYSLLGALLPRNNCVNALANVYHDLGDKLSIGIWKMGICVDVVHFDLDREYLLVVNLNLTLRGKYHRISQIVDEIMRIYHRCKSRRGRKMFSRYSTNYRTEGKACTFLSIFLVSGHSSGLCTTLTSRSWFIRNIRSLGRPATFLLPAFLDQECWSHLV